ncbi:MAG: M1 family aminopeptidase [Maricaulis sp.]|uniref:M1 family aminopeptidase n=1 Tax=Maricaulis sp. TaxID=1486257 RepID=UPI00261AC6C6|nr:M1 family aminopeptidase [Maricaulis sp.]MDM7983341.1 M1 family aminopeptidase [Maricaulis sp.]
MLKTTFVTAAAVMAGSAAIAQDASFHYDGQMQIRPDTGELALDWVISVHETDLETVRFGLNAALGDAAINGPHVLSVSHERVEGFAGVMQIYTVTLEPGEDVRDLSIRYAGPLFPEAPDNPINTLAPHKVELTVDSFWMPFDMRFSSLITAELDIDIDGDWQGVTMQSITRTEDGFRIDQDTPALDLAFTLMSRFTREAGEGYQIYDTREAAAEADLGPLVGALEFCTDYLNTLAGPAGPLPRASVTVNDRSEGGYSRRTLIALTDIAQSSPESLTQFICHELAHYWSYGNAMTVENWLNESFADQIANTGLRARYGDEAYREHMRGYAERVASGDPLPPVWTPQSEARPAYLVAYRKGPLALAALEDEIGRDVFARFLRQLMIEQVSTTPRMLDVLEAVAGVEAREWFVGRLAQ